MCEKEREIERKGSKKSIKTRWSVRLSQIWSPIHSFILQRDAILIRPSSLFFKELHSGKADASRTSSTGSIPITSGYFDHKNFYFKVFVCT